MAVFEYSNYAVNRTSAVRQTGVGRTGNSHVHFQLAPSPVGFPYAFWRGRTENHTLLNTQESLNATGGGVCLFQPIGDRRTRS